MTDRITELSNELCEIDFPLAPTRESLQQLFENDNIEYLYMVLDVFKLAKSTIRLIKKNRKNLPDWYKTENVMYLLPFIGWPIVAFSGFKKKHLLSKIQMSDIESKLLKCTWLLSISMYITLMICYSCDDTIAELDNYKLTEVYNYFSLLLKRYSSVVFIKTIVMILYNTYILTILRPNVLMLLKDSDQLRDNESLI